MMNSLPTEKDFDPCNGDLDARWAWKNFGGLSLHEAIAKFETDPENFQEDFMFMGGKAFAFYYPAIDRFLRKTVDLPMHQRGDRQSWVLPQCIKAQFMGNESHHVFRLRASVLGLCDFMLKNMEYFADDWCDVQEIETQWQLLLQHVRRCPDR